MRRWVSSKLRELADMLSPVNSAEKDLLPETPVTLSTEAESMLAIDRSEPVEPTRPLRGSIRDRMGRSR